MKTFDKVSLKALRNPIEAALKAIETEYGISISLGNARYTSETATFKLELATIASDGTVITKEARDLKAYGSLWPYNLPEDALGRVFKDSKGTYTITGLRTKASRFPILVQRADGKAFCFPADRVVRALNSQAAK